jgi:hydroxymethylpyrimidine/phosphomethylpyrimidine kinase
MNQSIPIALSIAGFDGSGGAGMQADLKTFSARGVYAATVLTSLPIQNTTGVRNVFDLPIQAIEEQIDSMFEDLDIQSVKIGMLHTVEIIELVSRKLIEYKPPHIVVDPVMVAKSGHRLLKEDAVNALKEYILPLATVLTPNLPEAQDLLGLDNLLTLGRDDRESMELAGERILDIGSQSSKVKPIYSDRAVVVKGGHSGLESSNDCLVVKNTIGKEIFWLEARRIESNNSHGTGCTFSAAIAAELAKGKSLHDSVVTSKDYLTKAMEASKNLKIGKGKGPVQFFHEFW